MIAEHIEQVEEAPKLDLNENETTAATAVVVAAATMTTDSRAVNVHDARRAVWRPLVELPRQYDLIRTLARRELVVRYRASALGFLWAFMTPLVMLALYTFVFGVILGVRFGKSGTAGEYALYLFCGLLPWTAFAESLQTSSTVVIQHANLVKRVVFPLETLPAAQVSAAIVNQLAGTLALILAIAIVQRQFHATMLWLPVLLVPQIILTLGAAWFIASFGVFVRDTAQVIGLLLTVWMYLTPIIYPEQIVPAHFKRWLDLNPFTALVRNYRRIFLDGAAPDFYSLLYFTLFALVVFILGYYWFAKTRKNFADVL